MKAGPRPAKRQTTHLAWTQSHIQNYNTCQTPFTLSLARATQISHFKI